MKSDDDSLIPFVDYAKKLLMDSYRPKSPFVAAIYKYLGLLRRPGYDVFAQISFYSGVGLQRHRCVGLLERKYWVSINGTVSSVDATRDPGESSPLCKVVCPEVFINFSPYIETDFFLSEEIQRNGKFCIRRLQVVSNKQGVRRLIQKAVIERGRKEEGEEKGRKETMGN